MSKTTAILCFHVAGDNESGKTSLIAKLQGVEEPRKGSGLEYYYIDVKDEYRDGKLDWQVHMFGVLQNVVFLCLSYLITC